MMNVQHEDRVVIKYSELETCLHLHEVQMWEDKRSTAEDVTLCCSYPHFGTAAGSLAEMCDERYQLAITALTMAELTVLTRHNEQADLLSLLKKPAEAKVLYEAVVSDLTMTGIDRCLMPLHSLQKVHAAACLQAMTDSREDETKLVDLSKQALEWTLRFVESDITAQSQRRSSPASINSAWVTIKDWVAVNKSPAHFEAVSKRMNDAGFCEEVAEGWTDIRQREDEGIPVNKKLPAVGARVILPDDGASAADSMITGSVTKHISATVFRVQLESSVNDKKELKRREKDVEIRVDRFCEMANGIAAANETPNILLQLKESSAFGGKQWSS